MANWSKSIWMYLCYALVFAGLGLYIYSQVPSITNYPFTISWSESGQIFNAYQVYAPLLSGEYLSWPWLDPARSIVDGLVLLLPSSQIWMYRFWIIILFPLCTITVSFAVVRKAIEYSPFHQGKVNRVLLGLLVLWATLFLLQGPVYYHVLMGVFAVLWFYDAKRPVLVLVMVILGSLWEGLCRVNWFLMPAFVATLLYLFSESFSGKKLWHYIRWPLTYLIMGGITSFLTYFVFIKAQGFLIPFFDLRMDYAYFLYKLWPNNGFVGLIPGIVMICFPLSFVMLFVVLKHRGCLHWLRLFALAGILMVFFAGSTVISLRAGGGYDLHNYDTLLLLLLICGCFLGLDAIALDKPVHVEKIPLTNNGLLICLVLIPVLFLYYRERSVQHTQTDQSEESLAQINIIIGKVGKGDKPILFIDQRQLLVYRMLPEMKIFVPYDKIELMEMAMARNSEYKEEFLVDVKSRRFSLIVSEALIQWEKPFDGVKFDSDWYENNVWVDAVSIPILSFYDPVYIDREAGFAIYAPKE